MINRKEYIMDDGSVMTVDDVMNSTGLSRQGAHRRLRLSRDVDWVTLPMGHPDLSHGPEVNATPDRDWDEPTKVCWGIAMSPSYLDGVTVGDRSYDRKGKPLSYSERTSLAKHREKQRDEWRAATKNIVNSLRKDEEDI